MVTVLPASPSATSSQAAAHSTAASIWYRKPAIAAGPPRRLPPALVTPNALTHVTEPDRTRLCRVPSPMSQGFPFVTSRRRPLRRPSSAVLAYPPPPPSGTAGPAQSGAHIPLTILTTI